MGPPMPESQQGFLNTAGSQCPWWKQLSFLAGQESLLEHRPHRTVQVQMVYPEKDTSTFRSQNLLKLLFQKNNNNIMKFDAQ